MTKGYSWLVHALLFPRRIGIKPESIIYRLQPCLCNRRVQVWCLDYPFGGYPTCHGNPENLLVYSIIGPVFGAMAAGATLAISKIRHNKTWQIVLLLLALLANEAIKIPIEALVWMPPSTNPELLLGMLLFQYNLLASLILALAKKSKLAWYLLLQYSGLCGFASELILKAESLWACFHIYLSLLFQTNQEGSMLRTSADATARVDKCKGTFHGEKWPRWHR